MRDTHRPGAGFGWIDRFAVTREIDLFEVTLKHVAFTQLVTGTAKSSVAFSFPIPVLLEPTRSLHENLLTRGTVLGQPNCGRSDTVKYSRRNPAKTARFLLREMSAEQACQRSAKSWRGALFRQLLPALTPIFPIF